ncbi:unnamed protein product [Linum trigynum]|uniref:Replication protein A 70 kDa DNA-binding subunit B/D first OB fold domain-containing protein n=1 Tax=Linum trigynum TaxID=586398 RepID=A0AAV2F6E5_9ROSI
MDFLILSQLNLHQDDAAVRVRILRLWKTMNPDGIGIHQLHMLFLDNEGTEMQGLVGTVHVPVFLPILREGRIYVLRKFVVRGYHGYYRVSPPTLRICFQEDTMVQEAANAPDIPIYSFRFLAAADLPQVVHNHAYLSVGQVVAAGPEEALFQDVDLLRRKAVHLRFIDIENVPLAIDYTLEEALGMSTICSIPELNIYKTDINNQGTSYIVDAQVKDVNVSWSAVKLKFEVRMKVGNGGDEAVVLFVTSKLRWIASRIIEATDKEWTNNFRILLAWLRGKSFKLMIQLLDFNFGTAECDLVLRKLFW